MPGHHCNHDHNHGHHHGDYEQGHDHDHSHCHHQKKADIPTKMAAGAEFATESVNNFLTVSPPIDVTMRLLFGKSRPVFLGFSPVSLPISISLAIIMALSESYIHAHLNTNAQEENITLLPSDDNSAPEDTLRTTQKIALGLEWGGHASQFASFATFLLYLSTQETMSDGLELLLYSPIFALSTVASWATVRACIKEVRVNNFHQKGFKYPSTPIIYADNSGCHSDNWTKTAIFFGVFQTFLTNMLYFGQLIDLIFNGIAYDEKEVSIFHVSFYGLIAGALISSFLTLGISYCELIFLITTQPNYYPKTDSSPSLNVYEKNSLRAYTIGGTAVVVEAINFVFHLMLHDILNRWQSLLLTFALSVLAYPFMMANVRMYEKSFKKYSHVVEATLEEQRPTEEKTTCFSSLLSGSAAFFANTRFSELRESLLGWQERPSNF